MRIYSNELKFFLTSIGKKLSHTCGKRLHLRKFFMYFQELFPLWEDIITHVFGYYNFSHYYTSGSNIPDFLENTMKLVRHWALFSEVETYYMHSAVFQFQLILELLAHCVYMEVQQKRLYLSV